MDSNETYGVPVNIENLIILLEWIFTFMVVVRHLRDKQTPTLMWGVNVFALALVLGLFVSDCDAYYRGYVSYFQLHSSCTPRDLALATWNDRGLKMIFYPLIPAMCSVHKMSWVVKYREHFIQ